MGIYLGIFPFHERNVALLLDWVTRHFIPQFDVNFNTVFHTIKQDNFDFLWDVKSGLVIWIGKIGKKITRRIKENEQIPRGISKPN